MTFQPVTGGGGYLGWRLLQRTKTQQTAAIARDPEVATTTKYTQAKMQTVKTPDDLVSDYRLLKTTLGAYGLEGDVNNRHFIKTVLEQGTSGLASRLADKRYLAMVKDVTDGSGTIKTDESDVKSMIGKFVDRELEKRVGASDQNLRLALNAGRELARLATSTSTENTKWYEVLGTPPLRKVFEGAFGLGSGYGKLPIERQRQEFQERAEALTGAKGMVAFKDPANMDKLMRQFLTNSQVTAQKTNPYQSALTIFTQRS